MAARTVTVKLHREGSATCFIPVPFDPKAAFGRIRAPVKVTLNGYTYRSTIAAMGGTHRIPLRKSHREAAGLDGTETLLVCIELDTEERAVSVPSDLQGALDASSHAAKRWAALSYSHQKEHLDAIESARRPETRARRIAAAITMLEAANASRYQSI
ncbi:MAG: YdeI/OmpD-associated family protein [Burkholderiaceae bacterium]